MPTKKAVVFSAYRKSACDANAVSVEIGSVNFKKSSVLTCLQKMIILWFIWVAVLGAALILHLRKSFSRFKNHGVKNPRVLPFLGNMLKVVLRIDDFATDMHKYYFDYPEERSVCLFYRRKIINIRIFREL